MADKGEQMQKMSARRELELRFVQDQLKYRRHFAQEATTKNKNENEKKRGHTVPSTLPELIDDSRHRNHQPLPGEVLNVKLGPSDTRPTTLPEMLALAPQSILLAIEPEYANNQWLVVKSCDVKILYDCRLAFGYKEGSQVQAIFQKCSYIMVDGTPRVVYPVLRHPHQDQDECQKSTDESASSKSLDGWVIFSRDDHASAGGHKVIVDRVGRVHDVCLASPLDKCYFSTNSSETEGSSKIEDKSVIGGNSEIESDNQLDKTDVIESSGKTKSNNEITKTTNVLKLPDWCSFYDEYYLLDKATRESMYPNAGQVWTSRVDGVQFWESRFGDSPTSLATLQYTCRNTMKKTGESLNIHYSGLPSFKVRLCQMQMSVETADELNRLAKLAKPERELTDIVQVSMINFDVKDKSSRQLAVLGLDPRYWAVRFRGWLGKKILRRD
ncbi:hypothetical protein BDZ45DRAFT_806033 [Acephala macrosclerotiorum]|nr:hypothetical protein BDZ45DRAFT_806033 [Acephala macrosclerotiorum]